MNSLKLQLNLQIYLKAQLKNWYKDYKVSSEKMPSFPT